MKALIDDGRIKDLFKRAIIEAIEEKKDIFHDLLVEVMEDSGVSRSLSLKQHDHATGF